MKITGSAQANPLFKALSLFASAASL